MQSFEDDGSDEETSLHKPVVASQSSLQPVSAQPAVNVTSGRRQTIALIPRASVGVPTNPAPAPQQQQQIVEEAPSVPPQVPARSIFRGEITRYPNYQSGLKNRELRICSGKFEGHIHRFISPNGSNYRTRCAGDLCHSCATNPDYKHALPVSSTVIEVPNAAPVPLPAVVPIPARVIQTLPQAAGPALAVVQPQPQPLQQQQAAPNQPVQQQGPPSVGPAALFKLDYNQVIKGKRITLLSGRYANSMGVFRSWNGNNWRWRCYGNLCGRCEQEPNFLHASPNDTDIQVHW